MSVLKNSPNHPEPLEFIGPPRSGQVHELLHICTLKTSCALSSAKRCVVFCVMAIGAIEAFGQGTTGYLNYQNTAPDYIGGLQFYTQFGLICPEPPSGTAYWAELWFSTDPNPWVGALQPVKGSRVHFKTGDDAGLIDGNPMLQIPGTKGGDRVFIQLRVWDSRVGSWDEVLSRSKDALGRGTSALFSSELTGVDADGVFHEGTGNFSVALEGFCIFNIPEPSILVFGAVGLGILLFRRSHYRTGLSRQPAPITQWAIPASDHKSSKSIPCSRNCAFFSADSP